MALFKEEKGPRVRGVKGSEERLVILTCGCHINRRGIAGCLMMLLAMFEVTSRGLMAKPHGAL